MSGVAHPSWRHRLRDQGLSALVAILILIIFVFLPLSSVGVMPQLFGSVLPAVGLWICVLCVVPGRIAALVLMVLMVLGIGSHFVADSLPFAMSVSAEAVARLIVLTFLTAVVGAAVAAPGPITAHRVLGAVAVYLQISLIFSSAYRLFFEFDPTAFRAEPPLQRATITAESVYFSLTTLTTAGFGDIVPINPFARALATFEAMVGQLYPATVIARLISLQLEQRRVPMPPRPGESDR